jgi:glycosyltransferase involved in cell wall biosynthesis
MGRVAGCFMTNSTAVAFLGSLSLQQLSFAQASLLLRNLKWRMALASEHSNFKFLQEVHMRRLNGVELAADSIGGPATLICLSHLRWNFVWQRPQHLLLRASAVYETFFIEEPVFERGAKPRIDWRLETCGVRIGMPTLPEGSTASAVTLFQRRLLDEILPRRPKSKFILWYYTPMALPFTLHLRPDVCVYDNMDELSAFRGASPRLIALERRLFERADVVFTGGQSLYEAKRSRHGNIHAFPSSIDASHFRAARLRHSDPADQALIGRPRLGFFGVIDERFDAGLLGRAADLSPDWNFVMIGPVVKIDPATLPQRPNIHWLGSKPYVELPSYLAGWDIGLMPFALNESTRFISPTKTPEFLAAGLPVVSTPITDVVRPYGEAGLVEIAESAEKLVACAGELLLRPREAWLRRVDSHLATMSWDRTWAAMKNEIERVMARTSTRTLSAGQTREEARV